jgi:hypothetical protein
MPINQSSADRAVRIFSGIAALLVAFAGLGVLRGEIVGIVVAVLGAVSLLTGIVGFCPAYAMFGASTCRPAHH